MKTKYIIIIILVSFLFSCTKNDDTSPSSETYEKGSLFIVNEGNYSSANSTLSNFNPSKDTVVNEIFYRANNAPLGDVAQSITFYNNMAFITINNSGHIYVTSCKDASFIDKIENLLSPRNIMIVNSRKAYVSDLYSTDMVVFNPETFEKTGSISIGKSTEAMVKSDTKVFVSNWSGYNQVALNNTVMVINSNTDMVVDSILVGIEPESMVLDKNNKLWVLCSGGFMNDENPSLWKISTESHVVEQKYTFGDKQSNPDNLKINGNGDILYFLKDGLFSMSIEETELPTVPLIESGSYNYYSIGIDKISGDIYLSDAGNYNQNGYVFRYDKNGQVISNFEAGIIPGTMKFYY